MTPQTIANGSDPHVPGYADALATGEYAALFPGSHLETHQGRVELPEHEGQSENVLFPRVTAVGGFGICGQGHRSGLAWLWRDGVWTPNGPTNGASPCIFDAGGNLLVVRPGPDVTSQGYRYVDENGRVWTGDETYADPARQIWEWSRLAGVTVGQGQQTGAHVLFEGDPAHRLLEDGDTRFIRLHEARGQFAIVVVRPSGAAIYRGTRADLQALPVVAAQEPPQEPPQEGGHDEPPKETSVGDVFATLQTVRAQYPTDRSLTPAELGALLNAVAWAHRAEGVGLQRKEGGTNVPQPRTGTRIAIDILRFPGDVGRDVLSDADGAAVPAWGDPGPADPATFVAPVEPETAGTGGGEQPGEPGTGGSAPDAALVTRVTVLEQRQTATSSALSALAARVAALEAVPPPANGGGSGPSADAIAEAVLAKLLARLLGKVA